MGLLEIIIDDSFLQMLTYDRVISGQDCALHLTMPWFLVEKHIKKALVPFLLCLHTTQPVFGQCCQTLHGLSPSVYALSLINSHESALVHGYYKEG